MKKYFIFISTILTHITSVWGMQMPQPSAEQMRLNNAVSRQDVAEARSLLEAGVHPDFTVNTGFQLYPLGFPLLNAARLLNMELVNLLLAHGADPNFIEPINKNNALLGFLERGKIIAAVPFGAQQQLPAPQEEAMVRKLLSVTDLGHKNSRRQTILMLLVGKPYASQFIEELLANPIVISQLNAQDDVGYTALMYAVLNRRKLQGKLIAQRLLQVPGIDINITDNAGNTALHFARGTIIEKVLLAAGAQPRKAERPQAQRAHPYVRPGAMPGYAAGPSAQPFFTPPPFYKAQPMPGAFPFGQTPKTLEQQLFDAIDRKDILNLSSLLYDSGANPNALNSMGLTPLVKAIWADSAASVHVLVNYPKTNINMPVSAGSTALDAALSALKMYNRPNAAQIVELLQLKGAKTGAELRGETPPSQPTKPRTHFDPNIYALLEVPNNATAYQILRISPTASDEEVKKAYRALYLKWHPDKNSHPNAYQVFQLLQNANQEITDARTKK